MKSPVEDYLGNLRAFLIAILSPEDTEESVAETADHLSERVEELMAMGVAKQDAERTSVEEFGPVGEIAAALIKNYPPKNAYNFKKIRWMPEIMVGFLLVLFYNLYSIGGLETCAIMLMMASPSLVIGGYFSAIARLTYRRMKPIAIMTRLATYGLAFALVGLGVELALFLTKNTSYRYEPYDSYISTLCHSATAVTFLGYVAMRVLNSNGKAFDFVYRTVRLRKP